MSTSKNLAVLCMIVMQWTAIPIHIWTVIVAYHQSGIIMSIVSLCLPFGSELFWGIHRWYHFGFANGYTITLIGWCAVALIGLLSHARNTP